MRTNWDARSSRTCSRIPALHLTPPASFFSRPATDFFKEWENIANDAVALLRAEAGRDPYDRALSDLIGELSTRSEDFRVGGRLTTSGSIEAASRTFITR